MIKIFNFHESYLIEASKDSEFAKRHRLSNRRFNPGKCLICGLHFDVLLHTHAESHGFKNAYQMINAGVIEFDYQVYEERKRKMKCKQNNG